MKMDLKTKFKRFFTLKRKANDGFTLVELIVVIAILAILGGVGVPAYSGYIEKTKYAADETLLNAVNKAFASACATNGTDIYLIDSAYAKMGAINNVDAVYRENAGDAYNEAFDMFYAGNEEAQFQVIKGLVFDANKHMFVDILNSEGVTVGLPGGGKMTLTPEQIETILNSTYADMGASALTGQIDSVADLAAKLIYDGLMSGVNAEDSSNVFYKLTANSEYMASIGLTEDKIAQITNNGENMQAMADYLANSLVVSAANSSLKITAKDAAEKLEQDPDAYIADIKTRLNNTETAGDALAEAALVYGVYTSYVNTYFTEEEAKTKLDAVDGSAGLIEALNEMQTSENWDEYMSGQGKDDVNAYLESMKVINSATSGENKNTADTVYSEGFSGGELENLLSGMFGKQ